MRNKISANYQLCLQDYIEARQLIELNRKEIYANIGIILLLLIILIVSVIRLEEPIFLVLERYIDYYSQEQADDELYSLIYIYSFILLLFFGKSFPKLNPLAYWNTKQNLQKNFVKTELKEILITSERVAIASQNFRQYYQWQAITKIAENKKIFLLYHSRDRECVLIPKRVFSSEAELDNFRCLLNGTE